MYSLTIVIPSNNRPSLLRRSIAFWSNQNFKVIICDGSDESQEEWVRDNSAENVKYYYSRTPFPQRIKLAADLIETKYSMLLSDDEFYLPNALIRCINFLDQNDEFIAAGGVAVGFCPGETGILGFQQYPEWIGRERIESSPSERVVAHMGSYANYLSCSVTRSHVWKSIASLYASREVPIFALWEIEMNLILSDCGKSKVLNNLMHFRSSGEGTPIRNNIPSLSLKNTLYDIWRTEKYGDLWNEFISSVSSVCDEFLIMQLNPRSPKLALERAIDAYCQRLETGNIRKRIVVFLKGIIPGILKDRLRFLLELRRRLSRRDILSSRELALEQEIKKLEISGVDIDYNDVKLVLTSINEYYDYR